MKLTANIKRDFASRSLEELDLLDRGVADWRQTPDDPEKLTCLIELTQSLEEMSGRFGRDDVETLCRHGVQLLRSMRERWPQHSVEMIAELQGVIRMGRSLLSGKSKYREHSTIPTQVAESSGESKGPHQQFGEPPSPFVTPNSLRPHSSSLRGSANSLSDFIIENLVDSHVGSAPETQQVSTRLMRLIDEVMTARNQIRHMFSHAVGLATEAERSEFLDQACATCPELRSSLKRLLKSESQSKRLLQFPASELIRALLEALRSEMLQPSSDTRPVGLTMPETNLVDPNTETTIRVGPNENFTTPAERRGQTKSTDFPRPFGRYTLTRELGQGAMGTVYLASDRILNRQVALKVLRVKPEDGQEVVERFYREARSMASLQHANLCPIYDFGEVDGQPYLTMAYVDGLPLSDYLVGGCPLAPLYAVKLARTLATALHQAHQMGIVHRDMKPANIMINKEGEPILMDFGLARRHQPGEAEITQQGTILGSPAYMSPEQVEGKIDEIGPTTDIHALGAILYEMLSGRKPYDGTIASVFAQILSKEPEHLKITGDDAGRLDAICRRAMAKVSSKRYASALDFANALTDFLENTNRTRLNCDGDHFTDVESPTVVSRPEPQEVVGPTADGPIAGDHGWRWVAAIAFIGFMIATIKMNSRNATSSPPVSVGSTSVVHGSP